MTTLTDGPPADHPLGRTLARARGISPYLHAELRRQPCPDWVAATELFAGDALEALVAGARERFRTTAPAVLGSAILQAYQWPLIGAAVACYALERRVPELGVASTLTRLTAGEPDALALRSGRFTALPGDCDAQHPDAATVAGMPALRDRLRAEIEGHLAVVIDRLCARLGCRPRGLWLSVADRCASTLIWLLPLHGAASAPEAVEHEVDALVNAPGSPLANRQTGVVALERAGRREVFLRRAACCHWFRTEGGEYCVTCPHRPTAERHEQLRATLAAAEGGA